MATGTDTGGAYRLTAARRFGLAALSFVTVGAVLMAAPSVVWAADEWHRTVQFYSEPCGAEEPLSQGIAPTAPGHPIQAGSLAAMTDGNETTFGEFAPPPTSRTITINLGQPYAICGVRIHSRDGAARVDIARVYHVNCGESGPLATLDIPHETVDVDSGIVEWTRTLQCLQVESRDTGDGGATWSGWAIYEFQVFGDPDASVLTHCGGKAGPNGDAGLLFNVIGVPAEGLSSDTHTSWGDEIRPDAEPHGACDFTKHGVFDYEPPEGITEGDTHLFAASFMGGEVGSGGVTFTHNEGTVRFYWLTSSGGVSGQWLVYERSSSQSGAQQRLVNAPNGARAIRVEIAPGTRLFDLTLANVEGNPSLDSGDDGTGPHTGPDPMGGPWANCVPGADLLDLGGWLEYIACLVIGIPGAIGMLLMSVLAQLFVPGPMMGLQWQQFIDNASTRVPFGWFAEFSDNVEGSAGAGASAIGALNLTIGSATVSIGGVMDDAMAAIAGYRTLILGGVALIMSLSCLRWILAAVGVSTGGGGAAVADG